MQCLTCSTQLSAGIQFCPHCGTAAPDNPSQPVQADPTVMSSPHQPAQADPTVMASPYQGASIPSTSYGAPPPPAPYPPVPDPYAQYNTPSSPYNTPGQQIPYGYQAAQQVPGSYPPYPAPPIHNYHPVQPFPAPPTIPPRKSKTGRLLGITAAVLVVIIIGLGIMLARAKQPSITQTSSTPTTSVELIPTPTSPNTNVLTGPSGQTIDPIAASIVTDPQTATDANLETAAPINLATTFKTATNFYITFKLNNTAVDFSKNTVYVSAKFYVRSEYAFAASPITIDHFSPGGYFKAHYNLATPAMAELYLCRQSDCSDEKLAQFVAFTITN